MTPAPRFQPAAFPADAGALADFLAAEPWPFHGKPIVPREATLRNAADGLYTGGSREVHWILLGEERAGIIQLLDLDDAASGDGFPLFDLRILSAHRGRGLGTAAVRWLTGHLFARYPNLNRVEGTTRADNTAMRHTFRRCHFALEGLHRESWPGETGTMHHTAHYALLRRDWEQGKATPVAWDE